LDELRYNLLSPLLDIPPDCLILMNEEGSPLNRNEAVQHLALLASTPANSGVLAPASAASPEREQLAGSHYGRKAGRTEKRIYVFDRDHLDADPDEVAAVLAISEEQVLTEPPLNPEDPLTSHLSLSQHNLATLRALISSISLQRDSLALALSNLRRVNTGTASSFALFLEAAEPTLERYEALLAGWEGAMDAVGKVAVVAGLLTRHPQQPSGGAGASLHAREGSNASVAAATAAVGAVEKLRFLGDYVSRDKMLAVRDGCAKVLADLKLRTEGLQTTLDEVVGNTEAVQRDLEATSNDLQDLEACEHDAEQGHLRIEELVQAGEHMTDPELRAQCFEELSVCDAEHRDRIRFLVERKNAMTRYLLQEMQKISTLQSDIASMPAELGALDHDLRTRTDNFKHLARLEDLIPAYVATVAEVVRRREYARLLSGQSTTLSSTFSPLSDAERGRRVQYRHDFSGKLPWEVRGLGTKNDDNIPEMALEVLEAEQGLPDLGRGTLDTLQSSLRDLEEAIGPAALPDNPIRKAGALLKTLIASIEALDADFAHLSLNAPPPPRPPSIDPARLAELEAQVRQLEESNDSLSRQLQTERSAHEEEVAQLEARTSVAESAGEQLRSRHTALEAERDELEHARRDAAHALVAAETRLADESDRREAVERELGTARAAEAELKRQWDALDSSHTRVQGELGTLRVELERAQGAHRVADGALEAALQAQRDLTLVVAEKDKLLRDQRTEAELDRAVLEKELDGLRSRLAVRDKDIELAQARTRTVEEIAEGLREQVARWEKVALAKDEDVGAVRREIEEAKRAKEKGIVDVQKELVRMTTFAREAVTLAGRLRDENVNITQILNTPPPAKPDAAVSEIDKAVQASPPVPQVAATPAVPPLDYASGNLDELLRELKTYTHDPLMDAVKNKVDSLTTITKKWVKEAKTYRERAHRAASAVNDKIAFRNFAKGDLALFLPTRNSAIPVWAAFNVSFPHHFLSATGVIAEQMKTREWIVARITSLTEKVVNPKDPSTNPYLLAAGTKYFTLEVEPWSSKDSSRARRHSSAEKAKSSSDKKSPSKEARSSSRTRDSLPPTSRSVSLGSTGAESAILVDRPSSSTSVPNIRRTMSESGSLPPNATALARSEFTIAEADEDEPTMGASRAPSPRTLQQPVPLSEELFASARSSPSGIARALARSNPGSPLVQRSDPFAPSSPAIPNPFASSSSSPRPESPLRRSPTPPATDYNPTHVAAGAAPAFLPSSGKKPHSASSSVTGNSPRYVRSSARPTAVPGSSRAVAANPSADLLSASPASTSASSVHAVSQPRSVSSGSSILSSSLHRRAASAAFAAGQHPPGTSPPPPLPNNGKAPSTQEAQLTGSRWNLLQEDLAASESSNAATTMTLGRRTSKGWPGASPSTSTSSPRSPGTPRGGERTMSTSASSASILDVFKTRRQSTSSSSPRKEGLLSGAEGEMRKLLGQPPF
ncbi:uncharacterized protein JCM10292_006930, partial [Rhodotorula paludigena]|uniref:uncharacterized protein n=1 Tax=Rhodotorula paludigena TaxID=86838 RepID=UPI00317EF359